MTKRECRAKRCKETDHKTRMEDHALEMAHQLLLASFAFDRSSGAATAE